VLGPQRSVKAGSTRLSLFAAGSPLPCSVVSSLTHDVVHRSLAAS